MTRTILSFDAKRITTKNQVKKHMNKMYHIWKIILSYLKAALIEWPQTLWKSIVKAYKSITTDKLQKGGDYLQVFIAWLAVTAAMVVMVLIVIHTIRSLYAGELVTAIGSVITGIALVVMCLGIERYVSGQPPTGGGKNP